MTILCLCREAHHCKPIPGYSEAFRNLGIEFWCADNSIAFDAPQRRAAFVSTRSFGDFSP
jgi:hypothetical protein